MLEMLDGVTSGQVTTAVRDTSIDGVEIKKTITWAWLKEKLWYQLQVVLMHV